MTSAVPAEFNFPEIIRKAAALFILLVICISVATPLAPKIAHAAAQKTKALRTLDVCNSQSPALSSDHETVYIWESPGKIVLLASAASQVTSQPQCKLLFTSDRKERPPQA